MYRRIFAIVATTAAVVGTSAAIGSPAMAAGTDQPSFTVKVNGTGPWSNPDDTPASLFVDQSGTFHYEQAHALYGASEAREWLFYTGTDIDNATADASRSNHDTTAQCNNSPTGIESTNAPAGSGYSQRNYCDITNIWIDPDTSNWYALVHNEFTPQPFGDGMHYDSIDYAVSTDQGKSWDIKGHVITSPYSTTRGDTAAFPQQTYYYGDGDPRLYVDTASGYFYVYYASRVLNKSGGSVFQGHVARAPIADKMAPDSWKKWYDGSWSQPGLGGKESSMIPATSTNPTGYVDPAKEYNPANTGTTTQQIAAGTLPAASPLTVMNVTFDAYLGLYIGEPQSYDQSVYRPQEFYATDNLATQKWTKLGDTGDAYTSASWYRWFVDSANGTSSAVVGKDFRSYCSFACSPTSDNEYLNVAIDSSSPASPVKDGGTYRIANADGRALKQTGVTSQTQSIPGKSPLAEWTFTSNGDGSYTITNAKTGDLLGVDSTSTANRAWGTKPVTSAAAGKDGTASVGQQWFVIANTSPTTGAKTGTFRLVNRYSGLNLSLSGAAGASAETTPGRNWTASTDSVGAGRTAGQQTLTLTPIS